MQVKKTKNRSIVINSRVKQNMIVEIMPVYKASTFECDDDDTE